MTPFRKWEQDPREADLIRQKRRFVSDALEVYSVEFGPLLPLRIDKTGNVRRGARRLSRGERDEREREREKEREDVMKVSSSKHQLHCSITPYSAQPCMVELLCLNWTSGLWYTPANIRLFYTEKKDIPETFNYSNL